MKYRLASSRSAWLCVLPAISLLASCSWRPAQPVSETWETMGTFVTLSVAAAEAPRLQEYVAVSRAILRNIETSLTIYNPDSELSRLNQAAGGEAMALSPNTLVVLAAALHYSEISGGAFDPTVAPLVLLWGFSGGKTPAQVPDETAIATARAKAGYTSLVLSNETGRLMKPGMKVDLGGIAKGYAVDVCFERIRQMGGKDFMVNLAGNLRCAGRARPDRPWTVAVRNPFDERKHLGVIQVTDGFSTASSGNYERFVTIEGRRYAHIIDPRTGFPVTGMAGTTVLCTNATEADAMSTALFILGPEGSQQMLKKAPTCAVIFVPDEKPIRILVTPELKDRFQPDSDFAERVTVIRSATGNG